MKDATLAMKKELRSSEAGMVSILICLIMMIVITLVVLGFSQISRNELTQALNRQLSTEAFYAANSGINNAAAIINSAVAAGTPIETQTTSCTTTTPPASLTTYTANQNLSPAHNISYSCIAVNPISSTVVDDDVFPLQIASATSGPSTIPITSINFTWQDRKKPYTATLAKCPSPGTFSTSTTWSSTCAVDVLEVNIVPSSQTASLPMLEKYTKTFYLYPQIIAGMLPVASPTIGTYVFPASCTLAAGCNIVIPSTYFASSPSDDEYYVRVTPVYEAPNTTFSVSVNATTPPLYGAQAVIDSTGDAGGILQRLEARIPLSPGGGVPAALQTGDSQCKLITGYPGVNASIGQPKNYTPIAPYTSTQLDPGCSL